jgi:hypothetical protein
MRFRPGVALDASQVSDQRGGFRPMFDDLMRSMIDEQQRGQTVVPPLYIPGGYVSHPGARFGQPLLNGDILLYPDYVDDTAVRSPVRPPGPARTFKPRKRARR